MRFELDYFYGGQTAELRYYRIPKALLGGELSLEAATLYGLMLDRVGLSARNGWTDGLGRVFIYFVQTDVQKYLRCGHNRATALMRELERFGLIERRRQGLGKPAVIYVKNISSGKNGAPENAANEALFSAQEEAIRTAQNGQSGLPGEGGPDCPQEASNKTEKKEPDLKETNLIHPRAVKNCAPFRPAPPDIHSAPFPPALPTQTAYPQGARRIRKAAKPPAAAQSLGSSGGPEGRRLMDEMRWIKREIRENIDYENLIWDNPCDSGLFDGYVELMAEACCPAGETVRVCGRDLPAPAVRQRLLKLGREHVEYVRDRLCRAEGEIRNIKAYTLSALYNAPATMDQYYASLVSYHEGSRAQAG